MSLSEVILEKSLVTALCDVCNNIHIYSDMIPLEEEVCPFCHQQEYHDILLGLIERTIEKVESNRISIDLLNEALNIHQTGLEKAADIFEDIYSQIKTLNMRTDTAVAG
jgi:hypothetical protein